MIDHIATLYLDLSVSDPPFFLFVRYEPERHFVTIPAKFLCVKGILFFSFWQGLAVSLLVAVHAIKRCESACLCGYESRLLNRFPFNQWALTLIMNTCRWL
jgi:hypothetical protein